VTVNVDPPELDFSYEFSFNLTGTYYFIFIFPFHVDRAIAEPTGFMNFTPTSTGTVIVARYLVDSTGGATNVIDWIRGNYSIEPTFTYDSKGSYVFNLPFSTGPSWGTLTPLFIQYGVHSYYPESVSISVVLPQKYLVTSVFPPPLQWNRYLSENTTMQHLEWETSVPQTNIVSLNDETLTALNPDETARYSYYLFLSGLLLGIGIPLVVTTVYDRFKEGRTSKT
jgi:hypothetical protein